MAAQDYPKTKLNTVKRQPGRGAYDPSTIHPIINTCPILHVSFNDPEHPFPIVLPMLGCTADFENQHADDGTAQDLYIHGYVSSRLFRLGKGVSEEGLPITVAASHLDGIVLTLTPFHNSCNYRSAIVYGHATLVTDPAESLYAMTKITNNVLPTRWENSRVPPTNAELTSTSILKVKIHSASAKVRTGGPSEDKKDLKDEALVKSTWTGVVPCWLQYGEPVPGELNGREGVEGYIERWRLGENARGKKGAFEAVEKEGK